MQPSVNVLTVKQLASRLYAGTYSISGSGDVGWTIPGGAAQFRNGQGGLAGLADGDYVSGFYGGPGLIMLGYCVAP
jgi:hypothetical protein